MRSLLLLAIASALLAGCTIPDPGTSATVEAEDPTPGVLIVTSSGAPQTPAQFTTAILEGGRYQHERLDALIDTTIVWWNVDDEVHSVVSDEGTFAGSGPIAPGGEFAHTFLAPGEHRYHCRYHDAMRGVVVVG